MMNYFDGIKKADDIDLDHAPSSIRDYMVKDSNRIMRYSAFAAVVGGPVAFAVASAKMKCDEKIAHEEAAVKSGADVILVTGGYAKKIKKHKILFKQDAKKRKKLISATGGACAAMIATAVATAAAAPATGGVSALVGGPVFLVEAATAAATTELSVGLIVALVSVCVLVGTTVVTELLRSYDLVESDIKIGVSGVEFHKKYGEKSSKKD